MDEQSKESPPHNTPNRIELTYVAASASCDRSSPDVVVGDEKPSVGTVGNSESMKSVCNGEEAIESPYDDLLKGVSSPYPFSGTLSVSSRMKCVVLTFSPLNGGGVVWCDSRATLNGGVNELDAIECNLATRV